MHNRRPQVRTLGWLAAIALAMVAAPVRAQTPTGGSIQGRVTEAGSGAPVVGAQVFLVGTQAGAVAGPNGAYRIANVAPGSRDVRIRFLGFSSATQAVTVAAGETVTLDFALRRSAIELSAVVVSGAGGGVIEERKLGNTVATITPPPNAPVQSFSEVIQGREPGVVGLPSSGLTGEGSRIRIRGNASLSQSNEPIIYVDGVRLDNGGGFGRGFVGTGGGGSPSRLDDIDPGSIERVEVLKGAAAATLYGTEASNGVIQIFTKRGGTGAPRWSFDLEQSTISYPTGRIEPNFGFARSDSQATRLSQFYGQTLKPYEVFSRSFGTRLFETGQATTLSSAVQGGTPLLTYYVSGRYFNEDGPFGGQAFERPAVAGFATPPDVRSQDINRKYQGTMSLGLNLSRQFRMDVRALYADTKNEIPDNNNSIYAPYTLALFSKPERAECDASRRDAADATNGVAGPEQCAGPGNPTGASTFATVYESLQRSIAQNARHFNGAIHGNYTPFASLIFDGNVGIDFTSQRSEAFLPFANNIDFRTAQNNQGDRDVDDRSHQEVTLNGNGTWNYDINKQLSSSLLFGTQGFITRDNNESATNQGFPGPGIEVVSGGSSPQVFEVFTSIVNAGFFAQEQLGFADWVFGTVGARYDYNSAFGESAGGVLYPKASISIVPSDRGGWNKGGALSTLRVRSAIGRAGRQPGAFDKLTTYGALNSGTGSGLVPLNLGNPDLKPEISTEWEVGTELGLFADRGALSFTRWNRVLNDALVARQFPVTGGFRATQLDNVGQLKSFGWELSLKGFVVNRPNVSVDLFANTSFISQLVSSLGGAPPLKVGGSYIRYRNFIQEGYAPGALFGAKLVGACREGATTTLGGGRCLQSGQLPFDTNGDGRPDTEAELLTFLANPLRDITRVDPLAADDDNDGNRLDHYLGKPFPDYQGGFGATVTLLKNWRIGSLFEYKTGRYTITDLTGAFRRSSPTNGGNTEERARAEATLLNPASTAEQRVDAAKTYAYKLRGLTPYDGLNQNSPGDFLRFRELSLTYSAPDRFAARVGARTLALTASARNLALLTKYAGVDPEVNVFGRNGGGGAGGGTDNNFGDAIDAFGFPLPRRFTFAVRAGF